MRHVLTLSAFICALFFVSCETASPYADWDADGDRRIDANEFRDGYNRGGYFTNYDIDKSSLLDENEFRSMGDDFDDVDERYADFDRDRDGFLSDDEARDGIFGYYDRDRDGYLDEDEYGEMYDD